MQKEKGADMGGVRQKVPTFFIHIGVRASAVSQSRSVWTDSAGSSIPRESSNLERSLMSFPNLRGGLRVSGATVIQCSTIGKDPTGFAAPWEVAPDPAELIRVLKCMMSSTMIIDVTRGLDPAW